MKKHTLTLNFLLLITVISCSKEESVKIDIKTELPEDCPSVKGHLIQTEQVILNLLTNARDAIQSYDQLKEKKIRLAVETEDSENIKVIVEDTGGGIPDNVVERIFEPFFTTKEIGMGTGLGLSVSYGIIRDMGGTIEASNTNRGARFVITLPIADAKKEMG